MNSDVIQKIINNEHEFVSFDEIDEAHLIKTVSAMYDPETYKDILKIIRVKKAVKALRDEILEFAEENKIHTDRSSKIGLSFNLDYLWCDLESVCIDLGVDAEATEDLLGEKFVASEWEFWCNDIVNENKNYFSTPSAFLSENTINSLYEKIISEERTGFTAIDKIPTRKGKLRQWYRWKVDQSYKRSTCVSINLEIYNDAVTIKDTSDVESLAYDLDFDNVEIYEIINDFIDVDLIEREIDDAKWELELLQYWLKKVEDFTENLDFKGYLADQVRGRLGDPEEFCHIDDDDEEELELELIAA